MGLQWKLYRSPVFLYAEMKCKKKRRNQFKIHIKLIGFFTYF